MIHFFFSLVLLFFVLLFFSSNQTNTPRLSSQVVSQFAGVVTRASSSSGSSGEGYPSSAARFAAGLGLSNLDLATFVPVGCLAPTATYYDTLLLKTLAPLGIVALLWTPAAVKHITRKDSAPAARIAARWSLFLMELIVSGVSTTVVQTFICDEFDDGRYLSAQLTLACDGASPRRLYAAYAVFMVLVYPIGKLSCPRSWWWLRRDAL